MPMSLWGAAASRPDPQRDAAMQQAPPAKSQRLIRAERHFADGETLMEELKL